MNELQKISKPAVNSDAGACSRSSSVDMKPNTQPDAATHIKRHYAFKLLSKLSSMRDDQSLCDYQIRVNNYCFNVHKCLLIAVSDFFKAMLTGK
jgi:hypothetical protein